MLCAIKQRGNFILSNERGQEYKFSDLKRTAPTRKAVFTTVFENSPPKSKINSGRCNRYACFYIGRAVLDTHKTRVSMLTWLVLSYPQKAHTHTDTELCIRSKKNILRPSQGAKHRVAQTVPIQYKCWWRPLSSFLYHPRGNKNPVLPVIIWTKHIFEPRRRTSQSFWPRRGTTRPEPRLSKRAHLEVYKEASLSLFSYFTWK